jgi:hypothetical protein
MTRFASSPTRLVRNSIVNTYSAQAPTRSDFVYGVTARRVCHAHEITRQFQVNSLQRLDSEIRLQHIYSIMSSKRKSDASTSASKKARTVHAPAQALVTAILANTSAYPINDDADTTRHTLVQLAQYARSLEEEVASSASGAGPSQSAPKTKEQLKEAAAKIGRAARSGIRKQMTVRPRASPVEIISS